MMHFTKNTVSVSLHCKRCKRSTPHKVWDGRVDRSHCLICHPEGNPPRTVKEKVVTETFSNGRQETGGYYVETEVLFEAVFVPIACTCPKYPGGHYHSVSMFGGEIERFVPGTWQERRA